MTAASSFRFFGFIFAGNQAALRGSPALVRIRLEKQPRRRRRGQKPERKEKGEMQRRFASVVGLGLTVFYLSGCATAMAPVNGVLYSDVVGPVAATSVPKTTRSGSACTSSYLGWVALGNAGIEGAKRNGGIS